jgi:hypothetical protein
VASEAIRRLAQVPRSSRHPVWNELDSVDLSRARKYSDPVVGCR